MITFSIDVTKIPRDKIHVKNNRAGDPIPGKWVDLVLVDTPNSQYGNDYFCAVATTKEERAAGVKGIIIGNARIVEKKSGGGGGSSTARPPAGKPVAKPPPPPKADGTRW